MIRAKFFSNTLVYCVGMMALLFLGEPILAKITGPSPSSQKVVRILSIDGGVYGVVSARILEELEKLSGKPICELVDVMSATSTGAIQIALLTKSQKNKRKPQYSAKDLVAFYVEDAHEVLAPSLWRRLWTLNGILAPLLTHDKLQQLFAKKFGNATLGETLKPIWIASYELIQEKLMLFNSLEEAHKAYATTNVLLAATSVPNFFPPTKFRLSQENSRLVYLTDALLVANDPALLALIQAEKIYPRSQKIVLSLGGGHFAEGHNAQTMAPHGLLHLFQDWCKIVFQGNLKRVSALMVEILEIYGTQEKDYVRINPLLPASLNVDPLQASQEEIVSLKKAADQYVATHQEELRHVVALLTQEA